MGSPAGGGSSFTRPCAGSRIVGFITAQWGLSENNRRARFTSSPRGVDNTSGARPPAGSSTPARSGGVPRGTEPRLTAMSNDREPMWRRYRASFAPTSPPTSTRNSSSISRSRARLRGPWTRGDDARRAARSVSAMSVEWRGGSGDMTMHQERARRVRREMSTIGQNLRVGVRALRSTHLHRRRRPDVRVRIGAQPPRSASSTAWSFGRSLSGARTAWSARGDRWKPSLARGAVSAANGRDWRAQNRARWPRAPPWTTGA